MVQVDAHEGDDQQQKDRFGDIRLQQFAERRQRDADHDQCCDGAGALPAEPCEAAHGEGECSGQGGRHGVLLSRHTRA
jgi:hypothetical protein